MRKIIALITIISFLLTGLSQPASCTLLCSVNLIDACHYKESAEVVEIKDLLNSCCSSKAETVEIDCFHVEDSEEFTCKIDIFSNSSIADVCSCNYQSQKLVSTYAQKRAGNTVHNLFERYIFSGSLQIANRVCLPLNAIHNCIHCSIASTVLIC